MESAQIITELNQAIAEVAHSMETKVVGYIVQGPALIGEETTPLQFLYTREGETATI